MKHFVGYLQTIKNDGLTTPKKIKGRIDPNSGRPNIITNDDRVFLRYQ